MTGKPAEGRSRRLQMFFLTIFIAAALITAGYGPVMADETTVDGRLIRVYDEGNVTFYVLKAGGGEYHLYTDAGDLEPDYSILNRLEAALTAGRTVEVTGIPGENDGRRYIEVKKVSVR